ncbi:MAG: hypothetical protein KF892_00395 [Rhizobacter sp.]|nr:hypothetical protein [Rhizobacter sp.]
MTSARFRFSLSMLTALTAASPAWSQGDKPVYRCPGNPPLYTDSLSAKEAKDKGCRTLEGAPITVIQSPKPRPTAGAPVPPAPNRERVDAAEQRNRDSDARRILEAELRKEEEQLANLRKEFNNGEPERRGDERNYQKYLDRVAEMKATIARKESDVAALRRELAKQTPADATPKPQ